MEVHVTQSLFPWEALEDSPTLATIGKLLEVIPDQPLIASLEAARGKGRNDFPVRCLWGVIVLSVALRHPTLEHCLGELRRNESLRRLIGLESEDRVPNKWNLSRFLDTLGRSPHRQLLQEVFNEMIALLGDAAPTLGCQTAGDATSLNARRKRPRDNSQDVDDGLPQASGGRKEYTDDDGNVSKVVEWFGFKLHLLADVEHEVALAYQITDTKTGDGETLPALLADAQNNLPQDRIQTLAYDKAADSNDVHQVLADANIQPLIQNRSLWKEEHERQLPGHDGNSNVVHDEAGTVYCYDRVSEPPVRHPMAYIGHEAQRKTLKYRCPAMHEKWECPMAEICNAGKTYGMTVRVPQEIDLRRFPSPPRATKKFERLYKGRSAVERLNARLKIFWGADDGNVSGSTRFHALIGVVLVVHAAFATLLASAPRWDGKLGQTRLGPIAEALHGKRGRTRAAPVPRPPKPKSDEKQPLLFET